MSGVRSSTRSDARRWSELWSGWNLCARLTAEPRPWSVGALHGTVDDERLLTDWPYLLGDLVKRDLPGNQRAVLPDDWYARGHRIVRELDDLRILGVRYAQEVQNKRQPMIGLHECGAKLDALAAEILRLEADLRREFLATFE
jgi:hypothetical protein